MDFPKKIVKVSPCQQLIGSVEEAEAGRHRYVQLMMAEDIWHAMQVQQGHASGGVPGSMAFWRDRLPPCV